MPKIVLTAALLLGAAFVAAFAAEDAKWSYEGEDGPLHWGSLSEAYASCGTGTQQSPIDIVDAVEADIADVELLWNATTWSVTNNGHTLQIEGPDAGAALIGDETYDLVQIDFHSPSEHALDGARFPMEVHFVHAHSDGRVAVIAAMIEPGGDNELFATIMAAAPKTLGTAEIGEADPRTLLPAASGFYRYQGSLTTPPCSETVLWTVMEAPVRVAQDDLARFAELFPMNARPLQPVSRRFVLRSN